MRVIATGTVEIDAGKLTVEPRSIDVDGPDFLSDATGASCAGSCLWSTTSGVLH